ncbi:rod-binding protein [uncultured Sphingomonas sp.]|uniref:rod-binding protein n=1 Tax=uncultured Sphingomonas sp. TaxID=158754 RepID=UPI0035CBA5AC
MTDAIAPITPVPRPAPGPTAAATAEAFEAVFLGQMAQLMIGSLDTDGQFSGGHAEEMFRGVLGEQIGTAMARRGGIGLAPLVMEQIIKLQGSQPDVD